MNRKNLNFIERLFVKEVPVSLSEEVLVKEEKLVETSPVIEEKTDKPYLYDEVEEEVKKLVLTNAIYFDMLDLVKTYETMGIGADFNERMKIAFINLSINNAQVTKTKVLRCIDEIISKSYRVEEKKYAEIEKAQKEDIVALQTEIAKETEAFKKLQNELDNKFIALEEKKHMLVEKSNELSNRKNDLEYATSLYRKDMTEIKEILNKLLS